MKKGGKTMAKEERKYWVKMNWRFNLDSMHTSLWLIREDMIDGKIETAEIMGETMDYDRLEEFMEEVDNLLLASQTRKVTGKEYGRIKAISDERNLWRYTRCIESGMSDYEAGYAFFD